MKRCDTPSSTLRARQPFVLWIGHLSPLKCPTEMIEIARALPSLDFVMIGSPYYATILDRLMKEKPNNLHYLGPVSDRIKNELIRRCSAGITTSKYEGFGWTPFEFLTEKKPVLAHPLDVFHEIYGDLIIYAEDISDFINSLVKLQARAFKVEINSDKVAQLRRRWNLSGAASRIVKLLNANSVAIFTRDYPLNTNMILGCDIFNWKLWKSISDTGIRLQIFANGTKYSTEFHLLSQSEKVDQPITTLRRLRGDLNKSSWTSADIGGVQGTARGMDKYLAKVLELALYIFEPICYTLQYIKNGFRRHPQYVVASDISTILGSILVKTIFGLKVACLIHDTRFYDDDLPKASIFMRLYLWTFVLCLRYVDQIIVVSKSTLEALSRFCPNSGRFIWLWGDAEGSSA